MSDGSEANHRPVTDVVVAIDGLKIEPLSPEFSGVEAPGKRVAFHPIRDVREIYELAWKLKCKGVTVFRYGSKPEQVLYIGQIKTKAGSFVSAQSEYAGGCPTQNCPFPA